MNVTVVKGARTVIKMEENAESRQKYLQESVDTAKKAIDEFDFDDSIGSSAAHIA